MSPAEPGGGLTDDQRRILQVVYDLFSARGSWPIFQYVDKALDRDHDIDLASQLVAFPDGFIHYDRFSLDASTLRLTIAGIAGCQGSTGDISFFLRILSWCVESERAFQPESPVLSQALVISSADAASVWQAQGLEANEEAITKANTIVESEQIPGILGGGAGSQWQWQITRDIRRFRNVRTLGDYLIARDATRSLYQRPMAESLGFPPRDTGVEASQDIVTETTKADKLAFLVMPFNEPWSDRVHAVMVAACQRVAATMPLRWERADDIPDPGRITDQIIAAIRASHVIVADLTDSNPNVMFELGYADRHGVPIVCLNQDIDSSPFDLKDWRQIPYTMTDTDEDIEEELVRSLLAALGPVEGLYEGEATSGPIDN